VLNFCVELLENGAERARQGIGSGIRAANSA
jgi:hypothetical protein